MSKTVKDRAITAQAKAAILVDIAEALDNLAVEIARFEAENAEDPDDGYITPLAVYKEQYRIYSALIDEVESY